MTSTSNFWERVQGEVRTASERARKEAERALRSGVLQMDLVSLRRDRNRAHANLGERVLGLWAQGTSEAILVDSEVLRVKALVESIEGLIAAKEEELRALRARASEPAPGNQRIREDADHRTEV
jgi:hypothetical protein